MLDSVPFNTNKTEVNKMIWVSSSAPVQTTAAFRLLMFKKKKKKMQSVPLSFLAAAAGSAAGRGHLCDSHRLSAPDLRSSGCLTFIVLCDVCQDD